MHPRFALGIVAAALVACAGSPGGETRTDAPDAGPTLSIEALALAPASAGDDYQLRGQRLRADGGVGGVLWTLEAPAELSWLRVETVSGLLTGTPVLPASAPISFTATVADQRTRVSRLFALVVECEEGRTLACGAPGLDQCIAGTAVCRGGALSGCTALPGDPPFDADLGHCGPDCATACSTTLASRCEGNCLCGTRPQCGGEQLCCAGPAPGRTDLFDCRPVKSDVQHCGRCGNDCTQRPHANALAGCADSACTYACAPDFRNCSGGVDTDGSDTDGCETSIDQDRHCGTCGNDCIVQGGPRFATGACLSRSCHFTCASGRANCSPGGLPATSGDDADGCETSLVSPQSCGACGRACPAPGGGGVATCSGTYVCGAQCSDGKSLCGASPGPGTCYDLMTDPNHCGSCGKVCGGLAPMCDMGKCATGQ